MPPSLPHTAPPLGALGLAAGHRRGSGAGHSPGEAEKGGLLPPFSQEKERGLAPLSAHAQGAQAGPLAAHGRRYTAGGARLGWRRPPRGEGGGGCCPLHNSAQGA